MPNNGQWWRAHVYRYKFFVSGNNPQSANRQASSAAAVNDQQPASAGGRSLAIGSQICQAISGSFIVGARLAHDRHSLSQDRLQKGSSRTAHVPRYGRFCENKMRRGPTTNDHMTLRPCFSYLLLTGQSKRHKMSAVLWAAIRPLLLFTAAPQVQGGGGIYVPLPVKQSK